MQANDVLKTVITCSLLLQNNDNLTLPFFEVITQFFPYILFNDYCICLLIFLTWVIFFMIIYVIRKIGGNDNSPNYLNVMVNYHYHGEKRVITRRLPSMHWTTRSNKSDVPAFTNNTIIFLYMIPQCLTHKSSCFQPNNYCINLSKGKSDEINDMLFLSWYVLVWNKHNDH